MTYALLPTSRVLAGDVRSKVDLLRRDAARDALFEVARLALENALPQCIPFVDIDVTPAAHWLPPNYLSDFVRDEFGFPVNVTYAAITACWSIVPVNHRDAERSFKNSKVYGFEWSGWASEDSLRDYTLSGIELLEMAANLKQPKIKRRATSDGELVQDNAMTTEVVAKQQDLIAAFQDWVARDPERVLAVEDLYNRKFNGFRPVEYSGDYLTFPGMSQVWRDRVRPYQSGAIAHGLLTSLLVGHEVGLGKTIVAIATIMERKRLRLSLRPMLVVKKSTLNQIAATWREIYPDANLLVANPDDVEKGKRQMFAAQIAVGDYDCVIVTHEMFGAYRLSDEFRREYVEREAQAYSAAIEDVKPSSQSGRKRSKTTVMKNLERARRRLEVKLDTWLDDGDEGFSFEELNVDYIALDEGDEFLALPMDTKTNGILGLNLTESDRALDLAMKVDYLRQRVGKNCLMVLTGTLISNGLHQIYVWQRLIQPEVLQTMGIHCLDGWLAMFARTKTRPEMRATGKFEVVTRLVEFVNLPELMGAFLLNANIKRYSQVQDTSNIVRPTPIVESVVCPMSANQYAWMDDIVERAELIRCRTPRKFPRDGEKAIEDNLLWVSTDARKGCLDMRTIRSDGEFNPDSKAENVVRQVMRFYLEYADHKATQLVFCDLSAPSNPRWSIYRAVRDRLIEEGVLPEEVAFIQDYETPEAKSALFDAVNAGVVRVLFGATTSMGVGVNVQQRLIALHNIDCPWRPRDLEQRVGRIMRSGNMFGQIHVLNYVTQGSLSNTGFDSYMWQLVEGKSQSIEQFMQMDRSLRRLSESDEDTPVFSPALIKALATGDDRILRQVELTAAVDRLTAMRRSYNRDVRMLTDGGSYSIQSVARQIDQAGATPEELASAASASALLAKIRGGEMPDAILDSTADFPSMLLFAKALTKVEPGRELAKRDSLTIKKGAIGDFAIAVRFAFSPIQRHGEETEWVLCRDFYLVDRFDVYHDLKAMKQPETQLGQITGALEKIARSPLSAERHLARLKQRYAEMEQEAETKRHQLQQVVGELAETQAKLMAIEEELGLSVPDSEEIVTG